ncbi:MAG: DUF3368 domain-containing protein [Candidatus Electrothrix sp. AX5]|jgi:predicted nucleic acid-binding protein|nr:DUF3368 domain-containing protein [Candidatus Electrothrix sp. AX5]
MIIIADSSPLITLALIDKLAVLEKLYRELYVPDAVFQEVTQAKKPFAETLKLFLDGRTKDVSNKLAVEMLSNDVGAGEAEAIVLGLEQRPSVVLIDDLKARKFAKINGLDVIGSMGILLKAKRAGLVEDIKPLIATLLLHDIRISTKIIDMTLQAAQEG